MAIDWTKPVETMEGEPVEIVATVPDADSKFYAATQVMDEARHVEAFSRLLHSHALGLPLDSAAKKREGRDHEVYSGRATNLLGSLQRAAA